jgi:hypothetical protein
MQDALPLRSGAKSAGTPLALLGQGELLEVRGERMDYLQVWDLTRERGGYVRAGAVRVLALTPDEAPELLALVRFLRDRSGSESLGLGLAAAYLKAAPAGTITAEAFDAMGAMADRLAWRANMAAANAANAPVRPGEPTIAAQLEVAAGLGLHYASLERDGHVWLCYDGDAFRHVAALRPTPEQAARAALALTRPDCIDDALPPLQRWQLDRERADLLARVPAADLPPYVRNRLRLRQAGVWATLAFEDSRRLVVEGGTSPPGMPVAAGSDVLAAGNEALDALAGVDKAELADDDQSAYTDAAMRVGASRWAAEPASAPAAGGLHVATQPASRARPACCCSMRNTAPTIRWRAAAPSPRCGRRRRARTRVRPRSRWRCSRWPPGASCGCSAPRRPAGRCRCCRRPPRRRAWATWSSPAGCRARARCWPRARWAIRGTPTGSRARTNCSMAGRWPRRRPPTRRRRCRHSGSSRIPTGSA